MKTVRIFKNEKYLQSETFRIEEHDTISFGVKEMLRENLMNCDQNITEDDGNEYVNVRDEIFNASDKEMLENVGKDSKEDARSSDEDEITAHEVDYTNKLNGDIVDTNDANMTVDAKKYLEAILEKLEKFTELELNVGNLWF